MIMKNGLTSKYNCITCLAIINLNYKDFLNSILLDITTSFTEFKIIRFLCIKDIIL